MEIAKDKSRWVAHLFAWIGGVLWAMSAFIHAWEIVPHMPLRLGNGQFGFNLIIVAFLFLFGGAVGGYWWRICTWLQGGDSKLRWLTSLHLLGFGLLSSFGMMNQFFYGLGTVGIFIGGIVYSVICYKRRDFHLEPMDQMIPMTSRVKTWFRMPNKYNVLFFILFALSLWTNNVAAALKLDVMTWELISVIIGRLFFSCFVTVGLYLVTELFVRAVPKWMRWAPWLVFGVMPFLLMCDTIQNQIYGRGIIEVINNLTSNGSIDVKKELLAGGFGNMSVTKLLAYLAGGYLLANLLAYILWYFSKKVSVGMTLVRALVLLFVFYGLSVAEQAFGKNWKELSSWQQEHKAFLLHQGIITPKLGLADFQVVFRDHKFVSSSPTKKPQTELPDIYIFMVESMRHDSMSAKTTPFLTKFYNDCQLFESTVAASNATHLSWYSMFYSKPSIFWQQDLLEIGDKETFKGSPVLNELNDLGYDINIRAVCDLGYKDFGLLNFGASGMLCQMIEQVEDGNELDQVDIPAREKIIFNRLKNSLTEDKSQGGNLYFMAMDSPHYNYYWDDDFEVPYSDYKGDISFPLFPSKNETQLYYNRYLNSVAWVDSQLEELCGFLKKEGRYENSIIIITGDHGEEFQEEGGWCHCTSLMPEQTHVPLLIKWPAKMQDAPAKKVASHLDVFPSVFSYLGVADETIASMNGSNLLDKEANHTALVSTAFANKNGETMYLKNDKYTAYFSWSRPWEPRVPEQMRLERIVDSKGNLLKLKDVDYKSKLQELFPDAFDRYFERLTEID